MVGGRRGSSSDRTIPVTTVLLLKTAATDRQVMLPFSDGAQRRVWAKPRCSAPLLAEEDKMQKMWCAWDPGTGALQITVVPPPAAVFLLRVLPRWSGLSRGRACSGSLPVCEGCRSSARAAGRGPRVPLERFLGGPSVVASGCGPPREIWPAPGSGCAAWWWRPRGRRAWKEESAQIVAAQAAAALCWFGGAWGGPLVRRSCQGVGGLPVLSYCGAARLGRRLALHIGWPVFGLPGPGLRRWALVP
ncbi:hypothetical protein NDU88_003258 [Pleurodeles waltl]|uniref:Uncharacterized protein n=1 Tax=Pleurodeles waltl TaxID=8319 RepID=A0AAV7SG59_PLEWA|nr:hypothetical protein NDU88_003258 [Pleurodeles waltl]